MERSCCYLVYNIISCICTCFQFSVTSNAGEEKLGNKSTKKSSFEEDEDDEQNHWRCKKCTFANHPALEKCEMCEMPKTSGKFLLNVFSYLTMLTFISSNFIPFTIPFPY